MLSKLPIGGFVVIVIIAALFVLALVVLYYTCRCYRRLAVLSANGGGNSEFHKALLDEFSAAYHKYGREVNTPAIIDDVIGRKLGSMLLCERFLSNSVSLFVTLGLFGTFLGLSMSVSSLTELLSLSNSEEWLNVLDSVGGGLMSALGGMGVAFYTSLVGAGCSILLTVLRSISSPKSEREKLETRLELWLDTEIAPSLATEAARSDSDLVNNMIRALNTTVQEIKLSLGAAALSFSDSTRSAAASLIKASENNKTALEAFDQTVDKFNEGVHDFSEVDYNLRGSVERMDLAVRDLANAMREINRRMGSPKEGAKV